MGGLARLAAVATVGAVVFGCVLPAAAGATTITVTAAGDYNTDDGVCTLREAVKAANLNTASGATVGECPAGTDERDTIVLPAGTYVLEPPDLGEPGFPGDPAVGSGQLVVNATHGPVTFAGAGAATTTIEQTYAGRRVLQLDGGEHVVQDLTISGGTGPSPGGGAIYSTGSLVVSRCSFTGNSGANGASPGGDAHAPASSGTGNSAVGAAGGAGGSGGAIYSSGSLTVEDSSFSGNTTGTGGNGQNAYGSDGNYGTSAPGFDGGSGTGGAGGPGGNGGAIASAGPLVITRATFANNHTGRGGEGGYGQGGNGGKGGGFQHGGNGGAGTGGASGSGGDGGAIWIAGSVSLSIADSTFSANQAGYAGPAGIGGGGTGGLGGDGGIGYGATGGVGGSGTAGAGASGGSGGAIAMDDYDARTITSSVFTGNHAGNGVFDQVQVGATGAGGTGGPGGAGGSGAGAGGAGGNGYGATGSSGGSGGAIYSTAAGWTLTNVTVTGNGTGFAARGGSGSAGTGGSGGSAGAPGGGYGGNGGAGGAGGAVASGGIVATHVTLSSNTTNSGGPAGTGTTTSGSAGGAGAGGALSLGAAGTLQNSIVAGNQAPSCGGVLPTGDHDVTFPDSACPGLNSDPLLGGLADNGGPTGTQSLGPASPARDLVPAAGSACALVDQRGVARPQVAACDAGAYEAAPPLVTTGAASELTTANARIAGSLNPQLRNATYHFEFGPSDAYGSSTPSADVASGSEPVGVAADLTGLDAATVYHYRLVASNADGSANGADQTFTTASVPAGSSAGTGSGTTSGPSSQPPAATQPLPADVVAPLLQKFTLTPRKVGKKGATFTFLLSEDARVVIRIERVKGKKRTTVGRITVSGVSGPNRKKIARTLGGRRLARGRYRASATATDAAGNVSPQARVTFQVV